MISEVKIISGNKHIDERGVLHYVNDFDMSKVKRMYTITPNNVLRFWRGHRIEQRWFYVVNGGLEIYLTKIDNWETPNPNLEVEVYNLSADLAQIIYVPPGYASNFRPLFPDSKIMIYADAFINNGISDEYQFPANYFINSNIVP